MKIGDQVTHAGRGKGEVVGFDVDDRLVIQFENGSRVRIEEKAVELYLSGDLGMKLSRGPRKSGKISKVRP